MRNIINMNQGWQFIQKDAGLPKVLPTDWEKVDLPHTAETVLQKKITPEGSRWDMIKSMSLEMVCEMAGFPYIKKNIKWRYCQ